MKQYAKQMGVDRLCRLAGISRSGYYEWLNRGEGVRQKANRTLLVLITAAHHESHQTYGAIRVYRELKDQGIACSKNRVARLMRKSGLVSVHRQKYRPQTTQSNHGLNVAENIVGQDFQATKVNQKWGGDISYVPTDEGWLYLSVLLDFHSRKVVGSATGDSLQTELCGRALKQACALRQPPAELIHHSDRGVQYASQEYRNVLRQHQFTQSMSRKGNCYDNAMVESFFHTLKVELTHRRRYRTREEARKAIENYIHCFYNAKRRHSSLDYRSPNEYENMNQLAA